MLQQSAPCTQFKPYYKYPELGSTQPKTQQYDCNKYTVFFRLQLLKLKEERRRKNTSFIPPGKLNYARADCQICRH